jgi:hypothetical protein
MYIAAPPRSLKSIIVSVAWVAFMLGNNPGHKFICASYSHDQGSERRRGSSESGRNLRRLCSPRGSARHDVVAG